MFNLKVIVAVAVLHATLALAQCSTPDNTPPICETSGGSPLVSDCQAAIGKLSGRCIDSNGSGSGCSTQVTVGTCKIDACGSVNDGMKEGVNCGGYLQNILNTCQSGGRVGGQLHPAACNLQQGGNNGQYRLQFSHS